MREHDQLQWKLIHRKDRKHFILRYRFGGGRWVEASTGESRRRRAESRALEMLAEAKESQDGELLGWDAFRRRYEAEHLSGKARKTRRPFVRRRTGWRVCVM